MLSVLYPGFLWAAAAVSAGVVGLHFLSTRQPRPSVFPTVRFVESSQTDATARALRFRNPWLLLLRVLAVLLIGAAFAQPTWTPAPQPTARVVVVDVGRGAVATGEARQRIDQSVSSAAIVVAFDETAREVSTEALSTLLDKASNAEAVASAPSRLSAALIVAIRAAERLKASAQTVGIAVISPLASGSLDAATPAIRALWPGEIEWVQTPVPQAQASQAQLSDASPTTPAVNVQWPAEAATIAPFQVQETAVEATGLYSEAATLIAPFERRGRLPADWADQVGGTDARVIAWWLDGEPAAVEWRQAGVLERRMGFAWPEHGDVALRPSFQRFKAWLDTGVSAATAAQWAPADRTELDALARAPDASVSQQAAPASSLPLVTPWMPWLLGIGVLLVLLEGWVRRTRRHARPAQAAPAAVAVESRA